MSKIITLTDYYYSKEQIDNLLEQKASISHPHGNITNDGVITNQVNKNVVTDGNGKITTEAKPTIPVANVTATNIKMNGTQSAGSLSSFARADHVHPVDTSRAATSHTHSNYLTEHQDISGKEDKSNKVTSLSSNSTDDEYPSAKAVYTTTNGLSNGISGVSEAFSGQVTNIWNTLGPLPSTKQDKTDNNLATNDKTVVGAINELNTNKQDKSNKTTSLSSNSTDDQYPSAKAVYNQYTNLANNLAGTKQDKITSTKPISASYVSWSSYSEWLNIPAGSNQSDINSKILSYLATVRDNKADKTEIPTKTSQLTNNSGFLTQHQDISGKEDKSNKVTSVSSSSTNTQYPSAKAVYDAIPSETITLTATLENGTTKTFTIYGNENTGD